MCRDRPRASLPSHHRASDLQHRRRGALRILRNPIRLNSPGNPYNRNILNHHNSLSVHQLRLRVLLPLRPGTPRSPLRRPHNRLPIRPRHFHRTPLLSYRRLNRARSITLL